MAILFSAGAGLWGNQRPAVIIYDASPVIRCDLEVALTASGWILPVGDVDVGRRFRDG